MSKSRVLVFLALVLLAALPVGLARAQETDAVGTAVIWDDVALSDGITFTMNGVTPLGDDEAYEGWLVSDDDSVNKSTGFMTVAANGTVSQTLESTKTLLIALGEQNNSGQSGWAMLTAQGGRTEVRLAVSPGNVESELVHIHSGACGNATLGSVAQGLTSIVDGSSVTGIDMSMSSLRTGDFAINSHQKGNPAVYTTCGNIPTEADSITLALDEQNDSGQSGFATLTARGSQTEVVLNLSSANVMSELVHIHSGRCGNDTLGPVALGLTKIAGGASASTLDATLASLRVGDLAINSHQAGAPANYTTCGTIPAGSSFYSGENLIHNFSKVVVTIEPVPDSNPGPSGVVAFSHVIPFGGITHIRHLLTNWPPGTDKGILTNLQGQLDKAILHANLSKRSATMEDVIKHAHHVINIVEGEDRPNFDGSFGNPGDGIGVLNHAVDRKHAGFASKAVPDDDVMAFHAGRVDVAGTRAGELATEARDIALNSVLPAGSLVEAKIFLGPGAGTVLSALEAARSGSDGDGDGNITIESFQAGADQVGAAQAYMEAQLMATYTLTRGAPPPAKVVPTAVPTQAPVMQPTAVVPGGLGLPSVGGSAIGSFAPFALVSGLVLLGAGGLIFIRGRRSRKSA